MSKIDLSLGETTRQALAAHVARWVKIELSTARADRKAAELAVKEAYQIVGLVPPSRVLWLDSPMAGAIAAALASSAFQTVHERVWKQPQEFMTARFWSKIKPGDRAFWEQIQNHLNHSTVMVLRNGLVVPLAKQIAQPGQTAPFARGSVFIPGRKDQADMPVQLWNQSASQLRSALTRGESSGLNFAPSWGRIAQQVRFCGFGSMDAHFLAFLDYCLKSGFNLKDINGIVSLANSCGWWWPFAEMCILTERPVKIILASNGNLHSIRSTQLSIQIAGGSLLLMEQPFLAA